jgi:hypothetical protein
LHFYINCWEQIYLLLFIVCGALVLQKAEGRGQEAEGERQKAEGRGQEAEGRGQEAEGEGGLLEMAIEMS